MIFLLRSHHHRKACMNSLTLVNTTSIQNSNGTDKWQLPHYVPLRAIQAPSILLAVAILFGNALVVASYKINRRLRTRTNAFLVSLAVSDFLVGSISMPMWIYNIIIVDNGSVPFKAVYKTFDVFSALASIYHLPFDRHKYRTLHSRFSTVLL